MLKLYNLLPDQVSIPPSTGDQLHAFAELEQLVKSIEPSEMKEDWLENEIRYTDRYISIFLSTLSTYLLSYYQQT